ncbi:MAG: hypothetical protein M1823_004828 [Watsoniomyces obsoletus]|nr:MAG: hypothetical protein M1823_004828 [Watsoniomyces obsoletus]
MKRLLSYLFASRLLGIILLGGCVQSSGGAAQHPHEHLHLQRGSQQQVLLTPHGNPKRVAIIGAGSAGASAAYYLQKYAAEANISLSITVFESSSHIGGRSTTVNVYSDPTEPVELGASIFVEVNRNLVSAAKQFNLNISSDHVSESSKDTPEDLGVWNGEDFVFTMDEASSDWWNLAKLLWKYGTAPIRTQSLMKSTVASFLKMYDAPYFPFKDLSQVVHDVGLTKVTALTGEQLLDAHQISRSFGTDIIQASTRVNYGQNLGLIHGLETMVCMATDGAMAVKGGNWQIFAEMIHAAKADLRLNTSVQSIERGDGGKFSVNAIGTQENYTETDASDDKRQFSEHFDQVILAAPLQFTNISITPTLPHVPDPIPYVSLHVTLLASPHRLSPEYFRLPAGSAVPRVVLTTLGKHENPGSSKEGVGSAGFWSISMLRTVRNPSIRDETTGEGRKEYLYKIFSPKPADESFLSAILGLKNSSTMEDAQDGISKDDISWIYRKRWDSYPYVYPRVTFEDIVLAENLYYTSGIESFISTMETSSLMGMNVARLAVHQWT